MIKLSEPHIRQRHKIINDVSSSMGGSTLLSLSLFIILLAFFIVLNAISSYEEEKVEGVFDSIDLAFATNIIPTPAEEKINDETQANENGEGDSLDDIQSTLQSILPGLNTDLTEMPNGGQVMAIRIEKNKFERLQTQLFPVLVRILNVRDGAGEYDIMMSSSVRNVLSNQAQKSHAVLEGYKDALIKKGIAPHRIVTTIERGNPAFLVIQFQKGIVK